jgi:hypothetical protein
MKMKAWQSGGFMTKWRSAAKMKIMSAAASLAYRLAKAISLWRNGMALAYNIKA